MAGDIETSSTSGFTDESNHSEIELLDESGPGSEPTEKLGESEPVPKRQKVPENAKIVILCLFLTHSKLKKIVIFVCF